MTRTFTIHVRQVRWYARLWRWIVRRPGNGSKERPYTKLKHAMRDIPAVIPAATHYTIDVTGVVALVAPEDTAVQR